MIWRPYVTSWSKSLSRCGLLHHTLCEWQLVSHYFEWVWVIFGGWGWVGDYFGSVGWGLWGIIVGGWLCKAVGGGELGGHCLIMPITISLFCFVLFEVFFCNLERSTLSICVTITFITFINSGSCPDSVFDLISFSQHCTLSHKNDGPSKHLLISFILESNPYETSLAGLLPLSTYRCLVMV